MDRNKKILTNIQPGPYPILDGKPVTPTEIDIIKVKKVFAECMSSYVEEVHIEFEIEDDYSNLEAKCVSVKVLEEKCTILTKGVVRVSALLEVTTQLAGITESEIVAINKNLKAPWAGEENLNVQCHVFPQCLHCFVSQVEDDDEESYVIVTCCIGILFLIKGEAEVQLLVPTFGYPTQPCKCHKMVAECPQYIPSWPPYPSQIR